MTIKFSDYPIRGIDISRFNANEDLNRLPDLSKLSDKGLSFVAVRVGYGIVKDSLFDYYWKYLRELGISRKGYWYLDYYSHKKTGMTAQEWGKEQADQCWDILKSDPGECPLGLDEENSVGYGYKVTIYNSYEYNIISRAFLERWDYLTGKVVNESGELINELYASPGWLNNLYKWHRNRPLWLAWYNRELTKEKVDAELKRLNWTGKALFLQYASDGDIDNNGTGDGLEFGMEYSTLDLNVWLGTVEEWSRYCGETPPVVVEDPTSEDESESPVIVPNIDLKTVTIQLANVDAVSGLNIRNVPIGMSGCKVIGWMENKHPVELLEKKIIGKDIWYRIGQGQWCAYSYNGIQFLV
jgi:hypothetical protein